MIDIDEYIEKSKNMVNSSDGGSKAFIFDDKVLVCYEKLTKYGIPRENEEEIMINVNRMNDIGVNSPKHLAMKREVVGERSYCYVLQERAKGKCYNYYCKSTSPVEQLKKQKEILDAPDSHFEKYVSDLIKLFYFGLEPKPKNFFYDKEIGFTTIDLLGLESHKQFNYESLKDILYLFSLTYSILNNRISPYSKDVSDDLKEVSEEMYYMTRYKIFNAIKKNIPNFEFFERFILRNFDEETLEKFKEFGLVIGDLTLNESEEEYFKSMLDFIVKDSLEKVSSGKYYLWQIKINEIRICLDGYGLTSSWLYHKDNKRKANEKPDDWDDDEEYTSYDYKALCKNDLINMCYDRFINLLLDASKSENNEYIMAAISELNSKKNNRKI